MLRTIFHNPVEVGPDVVGSAFMEILGQSADTTRAVDPAALRLVVQASFTKTQDREWPDHTVMLGFHAGDVLASFAATENEDGLYSLWEVGRERFTLDEVRSAILGSVVDLSIRSGEQPKSYAGNKSIRSY